MHSSFHRFLRRRVPGCLVALNAVALAHAATIYIDPDNSGDAAEDGTLAHPYDSVTDVSISSGNTYLIKRGTTQTITTTLRISTTGVEFGAYGDATERPVLTMANTGSVFFIQNASDVTISGLQVQSPPTAGAVISLRGATERILIEDCEVISGDRGISTYETNGFIHIVDCIIHEQQDDGIFCRSSDYVVIEGCTIYNVNLDYLVNTDESYAGGDCIQMESCGFFRITGNTLDHTSTGNKFCLITNMFHRALIENNTMIATDRTTLYYVGDGDTAVVRYNRMHGGQRGIWDHSRKGLTVAYNLIEGQPDAAILLSQDASQTALIHNNVFANSEYGIRGAETIADVRNNIFYNVPWSYGTEVSGNVTEDYNCYYPSSNWRRSLRPHSFLGDPLFADAANGDFRLLSGSPCIDVGADIAGVLADADGLALPAAGGRDIGMFEYTATAPTDDDEAPTAPTNLVLDSAGHNTVTLSWAAATDNVGVSAYRLYRDGIEVAVLEAATSATDVFLKRGQTYTYTVRAADLAGNLSAPSNALDATPDAAPPTLPSGWQSADLGTVGFPGWTDYDDATGSFTVHGSGRVFSYFGDNGHYAYTTLTGDGSILARVAKHAKADAHAICGVDFRDGLGTNSPHFGLFMRFWDGSLNARSYNARRRTSGEGEQSTGYTAVDYTQDHWLRLRRIGNTFTAEISPDTPGWSELGAAWTLADEVDLALPQTLQVGLISTAYVDSMIASPVFDNVAVRAENFETWGGTLVQNGFILAGDWMGTLYKWENSDWLWSFGTNNYIYFPDPGESAGGWGFVNGQ